MRIPYKKSIGQEAKPGRPSLGKKPDKKELIKLYKKESRSIREIAEILKCSKDMIYRSLKEYKIEIRKNKRRSALHKYKLSFLENGIKEKGIRGFARDLKISEGALRHHMKVRKIN